jgi:hypothetical protein
MGSGVPWQLQYKAQAQACTLVQAVKECKILLCLDPGPEWCNVQTIKCNASLQWKHSENLQGPGHAHDSFFADSALEATDTKSATLSTCLSS